MERDGSRPGRGHRRASRTSATPSWASASTTATASSRLGADVPVVDTAPPVGSWTLTRHDPRNGDNPALASRHSFGDGAGQSSERTFSSGHEPGAVPPATYRPRDRWFNPSVFTPAHDPADLIGKPTPVTPNESAQPSCSPDYIIFAVLCAVHDRSSWPESASTQPPGLDYVEQHRIRQRSNAGDVTGTPRLPAGWEDGLPPAQSGRRGHRRVSSRPTLAEPSRRHVSM